MTLETSQRSTTQDGAPHETDHVDIRLRDHGCFVAGGHYDPADELTWRGGMYVEKFIPADLRHPYPVIMIHGAGQTGTNFTGTPDGRRGWAHDFLRAGYAVYVVDQAERGRSGNSVRALQTENAIFHARDAEQLEAWFTAPGDFGHWPQAGLHTQWPGTGRKGDPHFDAFFALNVPQIRDRTETEVLNRQAGAALLDKIGPSILLSHSQSGPIGWLIADARPDLVKAVLAVEPSGPPFYEAALQGGEDWYSHADEIARPFGITRTPLTYDPPLGEGEVLQPERQPPPEDPDLMDGYLQAAPARKLVNLAGIPICILTSEASYHAPYDHLTSAYLTQAGVDNEFVRLAELGVRGNGHMVMLEKNNHEIADLMIAWLEGKLA